MKVLIAAVTMISAVAFAQMESDKSVALIQPGSRPQVAEELHAEAHERALSEDLPGKTAIEYKGLTAFGKPCHLRLTTNAYGDVTEGLIQSDEVSLTLDAKSSDLSRVRYHLPSRRMFENGEEAQVITREYSMTSREEKVSLFPAGEVNASRCKVHLELLKSGGRLLRFSLFRNCTGEILTHVTMCGNARRVR